MKTIDEIAEEACSCATRNAIYSAAIVTTRDTIYDATPDGIPDVITTLDDVRNATRYAAYSYYAAFGAVIA